MSGPMPPQLTAYSSASHWLMHTGVAETLPGQRVRSSLKQTSVESALTSQRSNARRLLHELCGASGPSSPSARTHWSTTAALGAPLSTAEDDEPATTGRAGSSS